MKRVSMTVPIPEPKDLGHVAKVAAGVALTEIARGLGYAAKHMGQTGQKLLAIDVKTEEKKEEVKEDGQAESN